MDSDEQGLSSPLLLAVVINNKTSFCKDLFFFFPPCSKWELTHAPTLEVRSLNHWLPEKSPKVLLIVFLVDSSNS